MISADMAELADAPVLGAGGHKARAGSSPVVRIRFRNEFAEPHDISGKNTGQEFYSSDRKEG